MCCVLGFYRYAFSIMCLLVFNQIKGLYPFKDFLNSFKRDREIIASHWELDNDLIILNRCCLFLYGVAFLFLLIFCCLLKVGNKIYLEFYIEYIILFGLSAFFIGLSISFFGELHIILYRNRPTESKLVNCGLACLKYVAIITGISTPVIDMVSNTPLIQPSYMTNYYQTHSPFGRGYGYSSSHQMIHDDVLKTFSKYNNEDLVNSETKFYFSEKEKMFVFKHKDQIRSELPAIECNLLGLKKGRFLY
jgi:energy-coupling factor transporter transmembrane protein EcfT